MRDKISKNHLLTRFILLFNIIFVTITIIFFILFNNTLITLDIPDYFQQVLSKMNILIFFFAFVIILLNAYLLVHHLFYNTKQYFKLAEKIDFNDLATSLGILNTLPSIDEYGDLGKRVSKLLRVYLNYANLMRKRLAYQDKKMRVLIEKTKIPILIFDHNIEDKNYHLSFVSKPAHSFLGLENSSSIIGKTTTTLFSKDTQIYLQNMLQQNPNKENAPTQMSFLSTIEWVKPADKDSFKEETMIPIEVSIIPFVFQFSDDYKYQDSKTNRSNFNQVIDYFFVLIHEKSHATLEQKIDSLLDANMIDSDPTHTL